MENIFVKRHVTGAKKNRFSNSREMQEQTFQRCVARGNQVRGLPTGWDSLGTTGKARRRIHQHAGIGVLRGVDQRARRVLLDKPPIFQNRCAITRTTAMSCEMKR